MGGRRASEHVEVAVSRKVPPESSKLWSAPVIAVVVSQGGEAEDFSEAAYRVFVEAADPYPAGSNGFGDEAEIYFDLSWLPPDIRERALRVAEGSGEPAVVELSTLPNQTEPKDFAVLSWGPGKALVIEASGLRSSEAKGGSGWSAGQAAALREFLESLIAFYEAALRWVRSSLEDRVVQSLVGVQMLLSQGQESRHLGSDTADRIGSALEAVTTISSYVSDFALGALDPAVRLGWYTRGINRGKEREVFSPAGPTAGPATSSLAMYLVGRDLLESVYPVRCRVEYSSGGLRLLPEEAGTRFPGEVTEAKRAVLEALGGALEESANPYALTIRL
jgi:hypothetical protein